MSFAEVVCYPCEDKAAEIRQLEADVEECKEKLYEFADLVKEFDDSRDPLILVALVKLAWQVV